MTGEIFYGNATTTLQYFKWLQSSYVHLLKDHLYLFLMTGETFCGDKVSWFDIKSIFLRSITNKTQSNSSLNTYIQMMVWEALKYRAMRILSWLNVIVFRSFRPDRTNQTYQTS
jgi:hypothetical protein